ncbi:MAG TPA: DMT family transporter [Anaerolineae bacterium]|nr:DMT family transporter [Anaerolineae bacterium]
MRRQQLTADASLLFVTAVWGATFVMVQDAVTGFPVFAFLALRFALAALVLLPFFIQSRSVRRDDFSRSPRRKATEVATTNWLPGVLVGLALFAGYAFQTFGLRYTTPAKAGFITGMSVVLVPLGQAIFLRRMPRRNSIIGVALAAAGLSLLTLQANLSVNSGDLLVLACAVAFAAHILLVGRYAPGWPPLRLAFVQILTVAVLSSAAALLLERPIGLPPGNVWFAAAFTGLLATALAFFVQSRAQQDTSPTHTALIFAAEPVFAGLFSFLLIGEVLGPRQVVGSALIVAGMVTAEVRIGREGKQGK